jgi:TPR repeat protein
VAEDDAAALQWYLRAAADGFLPAQNNVGFMNAAGRSTRANDKEAVRWYRRAARFLQQRSPRGHGAHGGLSVPKMNFIGTARL